MTVEENKRLARLALEGVWSRGDMAVADAIYAPDFVSRQHSHPSGPRDVDGREALKAFVREFRTAFDDFHDTIEDQVAEGDKVVTRFASAGTHTGPLMGVAPTGKRLRWTGINIDRIADGRIVENWVNWDMAGVLEELGVLTWPPAR